MQNFEDIVRRHGQMVYRLALASLQHRADAEDVFQEVFLRCAQQPDFSSDDHCRAWLIRVTVNRCHSLRRTAWFRRRAILPEDVPCPAFPSDPSPLTDALARLPEKYRAVIHLHYYENCKTEEIAALLHLPPATVRTRLARARRQLSDLLKGELDDDFS